MIRQLFQLLGIASLTAGAVLYFVNEPISAEDKESASKDAEIAELNQELDAVKEALADAQQPSQKNKGTDSAAGKDTETESGDPVIKMILTLSPGDTSKDASDSLEQSGIIKSGAEFEGYLAKKNLSGKMQIGQHEVDSSMDFAALAKELTTVKQ